MDYAWKEHSPQSFPTEILQKCKLESKLKSVEVHWKYIYISRGRRIVFPLFKIVTN